MKAKLLLTSLFAAFCLLALPAFSQSDAGEFERRLELSQKMHKFKPARRQIDAAIEQVSKKLQDSEQEAFILAMKSTLDYETLERHSIEAMAKVFTVEELETMIDFYKKPETKKISEKLIEYNSLIEPKVYEMLDEAMIKIRTGETMQ